MDGATAVAPALQADPFAALGAQYEENPPQAKPATRPAPVPPGQGDPFAALGAQYEPAALPANSPASDAAHLAGTNADIRQQLNQPQPVPGTGPHNATIGPYEPTFGERLRGMVADSAIGHSITSTMPGVAHALHLEPTEVPGSAEYQQHEEQLLAPEKLVEGATAGSVPGKVINTFGKGPLMTDQSLVRTDAAAKPTPTESLATGAARAVGSQLTGSTIALMAPIGEVAGLTGKAAEMLAPRLISAGFSVAMIRGLYQQAQAYRQAKADGHNDQAEEILGEMMVTAPMLFMAGTHALHGHGAPAAEPVSEPANVPQPVENVPRGTIDTEANPPVSTETHPPIGQTEPETGRPVLQQSPRPEVNQAAATAEHPAVKDSIEKLVAPIDGAEVAGARPEKDEERLGEKMEGEGQSPRTVRDYSGFRIAVDSPAARDQVVQSLRQQFEIPNESDEFENGAPETAFHGHTLQVREPGSPVSHEVQVLPREVAEAADDRHELYEKAREGDEQAAAQLKQANEADWQKFQARNTGDTEGTKEPEPTEPKFKYGSTQTNIPEDSEAAQALAAARGKIDKADLAGEVNGTEGGLETQPHVTVRYGIKGDNLEGVKRYLEQQAPFEATLGKTDTFPPSENSDGAAPIIAPVDAPELHRIEGELDQHGDFAERSFPDYKPHATLAYVKPEAAEKYVNLSDTEGKKFQVNSIAISDRNGNLTEVPLKGGANAVQERGAGGVLPRAQEEAGGPGGERAGVGPGEQGPASPTPQSNERFAGTPAAGARNLFGEEEAPGTTAASEVKPNSVARVPVAELKADPKRFQYKMNTDASGTTNLLKGRRWNDALAGVVSVWRDPADGQTYVVNGHHRFELAGANGVEHLNVLMLDAPDAETARSIGALQNIAEGRGTPMDAAKFFRDSGYQPADLDRIGISMGEATAANGVALARLDDRLFDDVVSGKLRQNRAIAIGNATDKPEEQEAILKLIDQAEKRGRKVTDDTVDELARMAKGAGTHTDTQQTLFGAQEMTRNLALEKAEVSSYIRDQIGKEKRLFGSVADEGKAGRLATAGNKIDAAKNREIAQSAAQAQELYDRLSTKAGNVDDILSRAAQDVAGGTNTAQAKQRAYEEVRGALSQALREPTGGEPQRIREGATSAERPQEYPAAAQRSQGLKAPTPPEKQAQSVKGREPWKKGEQFLVRDPATGNYRAGEVTYWNEGANPQAKPGGRSRIGNAKLDEIPRDALRIQTAERPIGPITGSAAEKEIIARTQANLPKLTADYLERFTRDGVPTLATDAAKELMPEFKADPTGMDRDTASSASTIRNSAIRTVLAEPVDPKKPDVLVSTASPGSGKTSSQQGEAAGKIGIQIEAIADSYKSFRDLMQQIIDSGRRPVVDWVYVDDPAKTVNRMFNRAIGHGDTPGIGRTVQLKYMADSYTQVPRVLERIRDEFGDKVQIQATDNSGPKGVLKHLDNIQPAIDAVKQQPYNQVLERMQEETRRLQREGRFDSERAKAILKAAETNDPDRSDEAQSGRGQGSPSKAVGQRQREDQAAGVSGSVLSSTERQSGAVAQSAGPEAGGSVSPEDFKAGLDEARKRSARENAATQQASVVDTPGGGRAVVMDPDAYALWHRAGLGDKIAWRGLNMDRKAANRVELLLRSQAGSARAEAGGSDAAAGYSRLVQALRDARNEDGSVTLLRGDYRPDTILEEQWHGWQQANRIAESDAIRAIADRPEVREIASRLKELGYGVKPGLEGRTELAMEMMAKTLSGDPDLKISAEQRYDLARSFLSEAVREYGPGVLNEIPGVHSEAQAALDDARRTYEPDEAGRGATARGAAQGRGPEGDERPGGAGGNARDSGGNGEPAARGDEPGASEAGPEEDKLAYQRTKRGLRPEDSLALPGMEGADTDRATAEAQQQGLDLTEAMRRPLGDVSRAAGEMERNSPLFFGTGDQGTLFQRDNGTPLIPFPDRFERSDKELDERIAAAQKEAGQKSLAEMSSDEREAARERLRAADRAIDERIAAAQKEKIPSTRESSASGEKDKKENLVARSVQDLVDAIAREPHTDDRTALQKVSDWTGRTYDESLARSGRTLREVPSRLEDAWARAKVVTAALVDGFRNPLKGTDWKKSYGQMDLAKAETAIKLRKLGIELKDTVPDRLGRIGMTHFIEAGGSDAKLKQWATQAEQRWQWRRGDPDISPRLKNHLADSVEHYKAALNLTPEQKALATRIKQHMDDMLGVAKQNGLLEYGARNYVRHLYEKMDAADLEHLLDTNELDPNPGFIERRIFQTYFEAENHGMIPRNKDVGYLVTAYDKSFNQALASRGMMRSLLDGRADDGRPLAAIRLRGKWLTVDDTQKPQVLEQRERPKSLSGYKYIDAAPTRNFLFEPTREDLDGYEFDPRLFEEDPRSVAFKGDLIFHPQVAARVEDMLTPGWFDRNENVAQKIGHAVLTGSSVAKETMTMVAPFHMVQLGEHSLQHAVNPLKLPEIDLSGKGEDSRIQRLLASNGLGLMDFDAEGLFSARALKGLAEGIPGLNVAMSGVDALSRVQFEDIIPRMKMKNARTYFDRNWKSYGAKIEAKELAQVGTGAREGLSADDIKKMAHERAERMVAELSAKEANASFGNLNTAFDSMHRSKTFKQLLRLTLFAPDFLESRFRAAGQAFTRYGGEQRAAMLRGALMMYVTARAVNALANKGDAKWDPEDAFSLVINGRRYSLRSDVGDILHLATDPRGFIYNRINPMTVRPAVEYLSGRDQMGRQKSGVSQLKDIAKSVLPFGVQKVIQTPDESWLNSILSSVGINTSNYRSPAEEMTHKLYLRSLPDLPDDPEKQAQSREKHQLEDALRTGKKKPADVLQLAKDGKMDLRQAWNIVDRSGHSQLYNEFVSGGVSIVPKHAGDPSALDIFAAATPAERMELRTALITKGENQLPEIRRQAPASHAEMRALEREWDEQEKLDKNFKRPAATPETQFDVLAARWRALLASVPHEEGVPAVPEKSTVAQK